jgi:hypothetical protein
MGRNRMAYSIYLNEVQVFEYSEIEFGLVLSCSCLLKRTSSFGFDIVRFIWRFSRWGCELQVL